MRKLIAAVCAAIVVLTFAGSSAQATTSTTAAKPFTATETTTGWRFRQGNICVQDQAPQLSDGIWRATLAWSKAEDVNLIWRRSCAGFPQSQTITVQAYRSYSDWYVGTCDRTHVWTTGGYMQPGLVRRAAVFLNTECRTIYVEDRTYLTAKPLGYTVGLARQNQWGKDPWRTVMAGAGLPTAQDYQLVEQIYPW